MFFKGLVRGLMGKAGPMATALGEQGLSLGANSTFRGALGGAALGGAYGVVSNDTSVLGGMIMGAGLGAGAIRYGGAALKGASRAGSRGDMGGAWAGARGQVRSDMRQVFGSGQPAARKVQQQAATAPTGPTMASNQATGGSAINTPSKKRKGRTKARQARDAYVKNNYSSAANAFRADITRERLLAERAARQSGRGSGFVDPMNKVRAASMSQMERIIRNSNASANIKSGFASSLTANFENRSMGRSIDEIINRGQRPDTAAEIEAKLRLNFGL